MERILLKKYKKLHESFSHKSFQNYELCFYLKLMPKTKAEKKLLHVRIVHQTSLCENIVYENVCVTIILSEKLLEI